MFEWDWLSPNYLSPVIVTLFLHTPKWLCVPAPLCLGAVAVALNLIPSLPLGIREQPIWGWAVHWHENLKTQPTRKFPVEFWILIMLVLTLAWESFRFRTLNDPIWLLSSPTDKIQLLAPDQLESFLTLINIATFTGIALFIFNCVYLFAMLELGLTASEHCLTIRFSGSNEKIDGNASKGTWVVLHPDEGRPINKLGSESADQSQFGWSTRPEGSCDDGSLPLAVLAYDHARGWRIIRCKQLPAKVTGVYLRHKEALAEPKTPIRLMSDDELTWRFDGNDKSIRFTLQRE